jgi:hypothetical protein
MVRDEEHLVHACVDEVGGSPVRGDVWLERVRDRDGITRSKLISTTVPTVEHADTDRVTQMRDVRHRPARPKGDVSRMSPIYHIGRRYR